MTIDFHYYTLYALCRLAGMKHTHALTVAYASQHTDDAKYSHILEFKNGGRYKQKISAHRVIDPSFFSAEMGYDILMPYHFLPSAEGTNRNSRLMCCKNSDVAKKMLEDTLTTLTKPYGLHRLGISLHVYADTWSHQNFIGLLSPKNKVKDFSYLNISSGPLNPLVGLIPPMGHTQASLAPDEFGLIWRYKDASGKVQTITNADRVTEAAFNTYQFLCHDVYTQCPELFEHPSLDWHTFYDKLDPLFHTYSSYSNPKINWKELFLCGHFGFSANIQYDYHEWFNLAVEVELDGLTEVYNKKNGFEMSDWKNFHDASSYHSFYVKRVLLPSYGILI